MQVENSGLNLTSEYEYTVMVKNNKGSDVLMYFLADVCSTVNLARFR